MFRVVCGTDLRQGACQCSIYVLACPKPPAACPNDAAGVLPNGDDAAWLWPKPARSQSG